MDADSRGLELSVCVCVGLCDDTCKKREKSKREKVEKMGFEWGYFLKANFK